jgi:hypothetical protein
MAAELIVSRLSEECPSVWHMSDQQTKSVLRLPVGDLVKAGANAPAVLVHEVVQRRGPKLLAEAESHRCSADFDVEKYVDRLVKSQLMLVRGQGALAGLAVIASEALAASETVASVGAAVPVALSGIAVTVIADLATLSYFQIELSLKIAAAYGHDLTDYETRGREILHLHGLEMLGGQTLAPVMGKGSERVGKRLLMRYLKGDALKAAKSLFWFAGIKFNRTWLVKMLPGVNVPVGAAIADVTTRRSANKARKFYATLPPPAAVS